MSQNNGYKSAEEFMDEFITEGWDDETFYAKLRERMLSYVPQRKSRFIAPAGPVAYNPESSVLYFELGIEPVPEIGDFVLISPVHPKSDIELLVHGVVKEVTDGRCFVQTFSTDSDEPKREFVSECFEE